ncbi:MAG: hypothetical protein AAF608_05020 [Pseudomonadota bacterium]
MTDSTIQQDVQNTDQPLLDDDAIAAAFGALDPDDGEPDYREDDRFQADDDTPPDDQEDEDDNDDDLNEDDPDDEDGDLDEGDEDADDDQNSDDDEDEEYEQFEVSDDDEISVKVNGEDVNVKIADLKRLAGQEAAITQKAQVIADTRRQLDQREQLTTASYQRLLDRVNAKLKPYEGLDLLKLARNPDFTDAQINAIQAEMEELQTDKAFLEQGLDAHSKSLSESQHKTRLADAQKAVTQLEDQASPYYVENFRGRYEDLKAHAIKQGADEEFINNLIDPWTWKVISDNLTLSQAKEKAETKRKQRKPRTSAKKTKRTRGKHRTDTGRKASRSTALKRLRANPSSDQAAADAFGALDE